MAKLIFRLNGVSDDEAAEVRALLAEHDFETYETSAGRWGLSVAAIWLVYDDDKEAARVLIDEYQAERRERIRAEYDRERAEGRSESLWQRWRADPVTALLVLVGIAVVAAISLVPFARFTGWW